MNISFCTLLLEEEEAANIRCLDSKSFNHCKMQKALSKIDVHKNIQGKPNDVWEPHCVLVYIHRTATENHLQCSFPFVYFLPSNDVREIFVLPGYFHYTKWGGPSYLPGRMACSLFTFTSPSSSFAPCCPSQWSSFPWISTSFPWMCKLCVCVFKSSSSYERERTIHYFNPKLPQTQRE